MNTSTFLVLNFLKRGIIISLESKWISCKGEAVSHLLLRSSSKYKTENGSQIWNTYILEIQSHNSEKLFLKNHPPFYSPDVSSNILKRKKASSIVFYKDSIGELTESTEMWLQELLGRYFRHSNINLTNRETQTPTPETMLPSVKPTAKT